MDRFSFNPVDRTAARILPPEGQSFFDFSERHLDDRPFIGLGSLVLSLAGLASCIDGYAFVWFETDLGQKREGLGF